MRGMGFLAIWSDVSPDQETDYLHWLTREHTAERLGVTGFLGVRVYRSLKPDVCRYFIHYQLADADVLGSDAYLARLNAPTPWSQRIMPILGNFARGGGAVLARAGLGEGSTLAAIKLQSVSTASEQGWAEAAIEHDRIVAAELLETDLGQTSIQTRERTMRARDDSFAGLLLIEGLDEGAVSAAVADLIDEAPDDLYRQVFRLEHGSLKQD
jgi:hypothetical protein